MLKISLSFIFVVRANVDTALEIEEHVEDPNYAPIYTVDFWNNVAMLAIVIVSAALGGLFI